MFEWLRERTLSFINLQLDNGVKHSTQSTAGRLVLMCFQAEFVNHMLPRCYFNVGLFDA